jgi:ABC-2 type transport system permease protein
MQVEYKGKKAWLRTFPDPEVWPSENHISGTIRRLTRDAVPEVVFTTGHYERSPFKNGEREFGGHAAVLNTRLSLINKGVNIDTVSLRDHDIPAKTTILVLADPRSALDTMEQHKVINWLEKGGDAVFYAEPGKQEMLNPVLQTIGVSAEQGTIVTLNKHELPNMLNGLITDTGTYLAKEEPLYRLQIIGKGRESINNVGVTELSYKPVNGFKIEPILYVESAKNRWLEKGHLVVDSAAPIYSPEEGDIKRDNYITGIKMYRTVNGREQRIIVTGDADFMSNIRASGGSLFNAGYSWIMRNEYPVYHPVPYPKDNLMTVSKQTGKLLKPVFIYIIPSIILLAGIILLIRRKRK